MGAIISTLGNGLVAIINALAKVLVAIVEAVTTILVVIVDLVWDCLCCRCCGDRTSDSRFLAGRRNRQLAAQSAATEKA